MFHQGIPVCIVCAVSSFSIYVSFQLHFDLLNGFIEVFNSFPNCLAYNLQRNACNKKTGIKGILFELISPLQISTVQLDYRHGL